MTKTTILVVDDTASNIGLVRRVLKDNYRVQVATGGAKALQICGSDDPPDLVLLDVNMPGMGGFEVCSRLKASPGTRTIPVIFVTAMSASDDETKGLELGAVDYITKPITPSILLTRVRTHLQLKDAMDRLQQHSTELEAKVQERTEQLSQLNEALRKFVPLSFLRAIGREDIRDVQRGDHLYGEMTIMVSDIRSYTQLAEHMSPREVFDFTNGFHGRMSPIVSSHGGFVQQYQGDGAICVFPGRPATAVDCAIAMHRRLAEYNLERLEKNRGTLRVGVGIHSGPLMVGVLGDEDHWESGVPSDTVNTAARFEGLSKYFGIGVAISGTTADAIDLSRYNVRFLSEVAVQGKQEALRVFEVFDGDAPALADAKLRMKPVLEAGQRHLAADKYSDAIKCFTDALAELPDDVTTRYYLKSASQYLLDGSPDPTSRVLRVGKE